jgi:hypothetical protein
MKVKLGGWHGISGLGEVEQAGKRFVGAVILSPGSFGTKDLHWFWLLKTHADPSLLLRMTIQPLKPRAFSSALS